MANLTAIDARWGDVRVVAVRPVSPTAVWAIGLVGLALAVTCVSRFQPANEEQRIMYAVVVGLPLLMIRLAALFSGLVAAYAELFTCPWNGPRWGRGLAWGAVGLGYALLWWHALLLSHAMPMTARVVGVVFVLGLLHLPVFAAESAFARYAVVALVIGTALGSLLSCAILRAREEARRVECMKRLQDMGGEWQERRNVDRTF